MKSVSILLLVVVGSQALMFVPQNVPKRKLMSRCHKPIPSLACVRTQGSRLYLSNDDTTTTTTTSPSGINALPCWQQQGAFFLCFSSLVAFTALTRPLFHAIPSIPFVGDNLWHPELMGPIFILAGVSHFFVEDYMNIYPPKGTWGGLWQLPGSAKFHVYWTGVAEAGGGLGLLLSKSYLHNDTLFSTFAALLLGLSIAVYPSNFYMFTHGAQLPKGIEMDNNSHAGRFVAQLILCGVLAGMI